MKISHTKAVTAFTLLFMIMAMISLIAIKKLQYSASIALASRTASVLVSTINQARISYSDNAVTALRSHPDISVRAEYKKEPFAIPNPATFAIELGEAISDRDMGLVIHTFSNFPFISRRHNGGPQDDFQTAALENISAATPVFERVEMLGNSNVLRHAKAIFMEESCISCHNNHPDSPKHDWQVGDVRGAVDVSIPISTDNVDLAITVQYAYVIFIAFSVIGLLCMFITLKRASNLSIELEQKVTERTIILNNIARTDSLTSIANRRHFQEFSQVIFSDNSTDHWPLALLVYDLDYFKNVNDTYGHDMGDECLKAVVDAVNLALRHKGDFHARIGGEEFAIILKNISEVELQKVVERILVNVSSVIISADKRINITCSIGSTVIFTRGDATIKRMMNIADQALYQAKLNGRNQACHVEYSESSS